MLAQMTGQHIRELLAPFIESDNLSDDQVLAVSNYLDLLLKWNARMNLTAVRDPDKIVARHFGESLFAARNLLPGASFSGSVIDIGSGAGFPGIPMKIWAPSVRLTLVESQQKKAVFLREVIRTLSLSDVEVSATRAEQIQAQADMVTLRAVERFESVLPIAARLVRPSGRLAVLIGSPQVSVARSLLPRFDWRPDVPIPMSQSRVLLAGVHQPG